MTKKRRKNEIGWFQHPGSKESIDFFNKGSNYNSDGATSVGGESMGEKLCKRDIKESLIEFDNMCLDENLPYMNVTGLYEAAIKDLTAQETTELKNIANNTKDPNVLVNYIQTKTAEKQNPIISEDIDIDEYEDYDEDYDTDETKRDINELLDLLQESLEKSYAVLNEIADDDINFIFKVGVVETLENLLDSDSDTYTIYDVLNKL